MGRNSRRSSRKRRGRRRRGRRDSGQVRRVLSYAIVGVVLAAGIAYFWVDASNRHPKATCLLLIDRTGSSDEVATVNSYADMGRKAADGCKSLQAQTAVFYFDQRQAKLIAAGADNSFDLSRLDADSVVSAIDDVLKSPSGDERSSDILVPLDQAADNLRLMSADVGGSAHLIVLSDGLHLGSEVSVEQITEDPGSIQPLIREAARLDLVPEIGRAHV